MDRTALKTYGTQQVMTSSPAKLVALLHDKVITSLREAIQAIEEKKVEARWKANNKATEIIMHLANTLDHEAGGEIAENLHSLYNFMLTRLYEVDRQNDAQAAREVIGLIEPLRDSWHQLADESSEAGAKKQQSSTNGGGYDSGDGESPSLAAAAGGVNLSA